MSRHAQDTHQGKQCRGPLLCQTNPPPNPVCTGKPCLPNQILHRSGFVRETTALPNQNRNHRLAPHNSARQTGAKARAGRSPEQAPTETSTRRANPPDQAAPGIQTEIASLNGDRRFQLQRSGTISSGPLKKLRVSCVHERDGKQVPCVRSLCSYARESRAC